MAGAFDDYCVSQVRQAASFFAANGRAPTVGELNKFPLYRKSLARAVELGYLNDPQVDHGAIRARTTGPLKTLLDGASPNQAFTYTELRDTFGLSAPEIDQLIGQGSLARIYNVPRRSSFAPMINENPYLVLGKATKVLLLPGTAMTCEPTKSGLHVVTTTAQGQLPISRIVETIRTLRTQRRGDNRGP